MKLIHSHPECRDIAIWYDEFLTPGESFKENIDKMLKDSKLFALLVTPNLLEEPDGKPNYVMSTEYPQARNSRMDILPAEMEKTDRDLLASKYEGIPKCINPHDDEIFRERLLNSLSKIATSASDDDPEHNYLIGLAYLDGIDVEINRERGIDLIIQAAESELPDAMKKLYNMYDEGQYVTVDYRKAFYWAEKIFEYNKRTFGEFHPNTLVWLNNLAYTYGKLGDYQKRWNCKIRCMNSVLKH